MKEKWHDTFHRFLLRAGFIVLAAFLIMPLMSPTSTLAAESVVCDPTTNIGTDSDGDGVADDSDGDGLTDDEERAGIINLEPYPLDPHKPDAFVEIRYDSPSLIDGDLDLLKSLNEGGLNIRFHKLPANTLDIERILLQRADGSCLKGIKVIEDSSNDDCYVVLGKTNQGPVNNDEGPVFIYTDRIYCFVYNENDCATRSDCIAITDGITGATTAQDIFNDLIINTVAHEGGHRVGLGPVYKEKFGGNHYKEGEGIMMEQSSKVTNRRSGVIFYISKQFSGESIQGAVLQ